MSVAGDPANDPADNPLRTLDVPLPLDRIQAHHVAPAVTAWIDRAHAVLRNLGNDYEHSLGALAPIDAALDTVMNVVHLRDAVATSPAWRAARQGADAQVAALARTTANHPGLRAALDRLHDAPPRTALQRRHVRWMADQCVQRGAALAPPAQRELAATQDALGALTTHAAPDDNAAPGRVRQILALRRQWARLLGYADFGQLQQRDSMLGPPPALQTFLADQRAHWQAKSTAPDERDDPDAVRPYFALPRVLHGMFDLAQRLFGVTAVADPTLPTWHASVTAWRLYDGTETLGVLYLDLHPRATKRSTGGTWMHGLATGPGRAAAVLCASVPSHLSHRQVCMLFHELGHLLHHMLSRVPVRALAGVAVARAFVELPSLVLEHFAAEPTCLDRFARHQDTGRPLPVALRDAMLRAHAAAHARRSLRQVAVAEVDRVWHAEIDPDDARVCPLDVAATILAAHGDGTVPDRTQTLAAVAPLLRHPVGYAAGYYAYPWGAHLAARVLARLAPEGRIDADVGMAFRHTILARGAAQPPAVLFAQFQAATAR